MDNAALAEALAPLSQAQDEIAEGVKQALETITAVKESQADFDARVAAIEARAESAEKNDALRRAEIQAIARAHQAQGLPGYTPPEDPDQRFDLLRACVGHAKGWTGDYAKTPEYELVHEFAAETKAQQGTEAELGGFLVPTMFLEDRFLPELLPNSVAISAGVEFLPNLSGGDLEIPREDGGITVYRKGELQPTVQETEEKYGVVTLKSDKELIGMVRIPRSLLRQTSSRVRGYAERKLARKAALRQDLDFFKGSGVGATPTGVVNAEGVLEVDASGLTASGANQTLTDLLDETIYALKNANAYGPKVVIFTTPMGVFELRKGKDADGKPLLFDSKDPSAVNGILAARLWGHVCAETTQLTYGTAEDDLIAMTVMYGLIGQWGTLEIVPNMLESSAYSQNAMLIRAVMATDSMTQRGEGVVRWTGWDNS